MLKGFKDFILRGNVVDLAVAVIIGAAFAAITASITADVITPLIAAFIGTPDFSSLVIHVPVLHTVVAPNPLPANYVPPGEIHIGKFLNTIINFLINAAAIYFLIVVPMKYVLSRSEKAAVVDAPVTKTCPQCISTVPLAATRCAFCTEPLPSVS